MSQTCPHCKKEIPIDHVQQGGLHIGCYEAVIDVYFISLPCDPKSGYYDHNPKNIFEMLKNSDCEDSYLIQRQQMKAGRYYNLPDFEGF